MSNVASAFEYLLKHSWPDADVGLQGKKLADSASVHAFQQHLMLLAEKVRLTYPNARFWWKDERSHFLGACSQFIADAGLTQDDLLSGIADSDPRLPWTRQAVLYIRDDREVFDSNEARINIVERQDRPEGTIWLKTSKVPFRNQDMLTGGTVGGFEIITAQEAWRYSRQKDGE